MHEESELVCNPLDPPCYLKWSMIDLNMEVVLTSPSYVCGERSRAPHVRDCSPRRAWRNMRAHDIRVNGPLKSSLSPCAVLLPFAVFVFYYLAFVFGYLAFKSTEIWNPNRFPNFSEPITTRGRGLFYISDPSASTKTYLIELEFCLSLLLLPS